MNIDQLNKASQLSSQHFNLIKEIDYLKQMCELLVTGKTKSKVLLHVCDMKHKESLIESFERKAAIEKLDGNESPNVFFMPIGPGENGNPPSLESVFNKMFGGKQSSGKSSQKQDQADHKIGTGCMEIQNELDVKLAVSICQLIITYREKELKKIASTLKKYGVEI